MTKLTEIPVGVIIPEDAMQERIKEIKRMKSFDEEREKFAKQKIEQRLREQVEKLKQERRVGFLSDFGIDDDLGKLYFKLVYDVHTAGLRVTLVEGKSLCDPTSLDPTLNARVSIQLKSIYDSEITIQPRPKFKLIPDSKKTENMGQNFTEKKTETIEPYSSSIYWGNNHPVWNEDFIFDDIPNKRLPDLKLTLTVYNCQKGNFTQTTTDLCLGEVSFPLEKIYKRIATVDATHVVVKYPLEAAPDESKTEETPLVPLPSQKVAINDEFFAHWMEAGHRSIDQEDEMEELASLCTSEPVREELMDPDLMDSVSIRLSRYEEPGSVDYRKQIRALTEQKQKSIGSLWSCVTLCCTKRIDRGNQNIISCQSDYWTNSSLKVTDLVQFTKAGNQKETSEPPEGENAVWKCSEPDVPKDERPFVVRKIEGWRYVNCIPGLRASYGELEIGLNYQQRIQKLTISILKGRGIIAPNGNFMGIRVAIQRRDSVPKSRFLISREARLAVSKVKLGKLKMTKLREDTCNPIWYESFYYSVNVLELQTVTFDISVFGNNQTIYAFRLGMQANPFALKHWKRMLKADGGQVSVFYKMH